MMTPKEVAAVAAKALDDRKGVDIRLLEITDVTTLADYFLICTGTSSTHVKSLCDAVEEFNPLDPVEPTGEGETSWP